MYWCIHATWFFVLRVPYLKKDETNPPGLLKYEVSQLFQSACIIEGVDLGATGRIALMAKLAEGTGFNLPPAAQSALDMQANNMHNLNIQTPTIATQCFMLSNMFDPNK